MIDKDADQPVDAHMKPAPVHERRQHARDEHELLKKRRQLEQEFKDQYRPEITVMFTRAAFTEQAYDNPTGHLDLTTSIIEKCQGKVVKTINHGTISYFESAQMAVKAAAKIQNLIRESNRSKVRVPEIHIGIDTGTGIVEPNDIFGQVVDTAAQLNRMAQLNEIYISHDTYLSLIDKGEYFCKHVDTATLKDQKKLEKIHQVYWAEDLIKESDMFFASSNQQTHKPFRLMPLVRVVVFFGAIMGFVFLTMQLADYLASQPYVEDTRTISHKVLRN
jgi:adenylate cyclase